MNLQTNTVNNPSHTLHQQTSPNYQYKRITSSYQKLPLLPLMQQQSPKEDKQVADHNYYNTQYSPPPPEKFTNNSSTQYYLQHKTLFPPPHPTKDKAPDNDPPSANRNLSKPKVVFCYSRNGSGQGNRIATIPNSNGTSKSHEINEKISIEEFEVNHQKNNKK